MFHETAYQKYSGEQLILLLKAASFLSKAWKIKGKIDDLICIFSNFSCIMHVLSVIYEFYCRQEDLKSDCKND